MQKLCHTFNTIKRKFDFNKKDAQDPALASIVVTLFIQNSETNDNSSVSNYTTFFKQTLIKFIFYFKKNITEESKEKVLQKK